jgi:hypothetical protein
MLTVMDDNMLMELIPGYLCIALFIACIVVLADPTEEKPTDQEK